jgi:hypothetical protein
VCHEIFVLGVFVNQLYDAFIKGSITLLIGDFRGLDHRAGILNNLWGLGTE